MDMAVETHLGIKKSKDICYLKICIYNEKCRATAQTVLHMDHVF